MGEIMEVVTVVGVTNLSMNLMEAGMAEDMVAATELDTPYSTNPMAPVLRARH